MEVTAAYQVGLERLGGSSGSSATPGAFVGYPVLTFNSNMAVPRDDPRTVAAAIRFTDVTAGSGLEGVGGLPESVASSPRGGGGLGGGGLEQGRGGECVVRG